MSMEGGDRRVAVVMITHNRRRRGGADPGAPAPTPRAPRVVVVDNGSTDGTADAIAARFPQFEVIEPGANLGASGRNLGVERIDAPYVAFCDDDPGGSPATSRRAADLLDAHPRLAVVTGRILVGPEDREDPICDEIESSPLPPDERAARLPADQLPGRGVGRPAVGVPGGQRVPPTALPRRRGGVARRRPAGPRLPMGYVPEVTVHHHPSTARDPHLRRPRGSATRSGSPGSAAPWPSALRRTLWMARSVPRDRVSLSGFGAALVGLPWVLRLRRVVPPEVEHR